MKTLNFFLLGLIFLEIIACNNNPTSGGTNIEKTKTVSKLETIQKNNPYITIAKLDSVGKEIDNGKKKIYLTFDDGPNPGTRNVIDALKELKIPATFYMIGLHRYYGPLQDALWKEVNSIPYFEVCNHSFTHAYKNHFPKFYNDMPGALNDFVRVQDSLKFNNRIVRGPGSNEWRLDGVYKTDRKLNQRIAIFDSLYKMGFYITGWDWEWQHFKNVAKQTPDELIGQMNGILKSKQTIKPNHLILLTHDMIFHDTADAAKLKEFLIKLKSDTMVEFRTISQYPGAEKAFQ